MTAERYTAVFTGLFSLKKPGEYTYLTMDDDLLGPSTHSLRQGRPPYEKIGSEVPFEDFPEGCRRLVLDTYHKLWDL